MPFTVDQFNVLTEKTLLFLLILKQNGEITDHSKRCKALFPIDKKNINGSNLSELIIDEDVFLFKNSMSQLSEANSIITKSFSFSTEQHGILSLKFDFIYSEGLIYATGIDVTDEYKEHRALHTISKLTKTGGWYYSPITKEFYWSNGCYLIKDVDPNTPITPELNFSFYDQNSRAKAENYLNELIANKKPFRYTEKIITQKGREKWIKVIAQPVVHKDKVVFVNGTIADITDRHHRLEKLKHNEETKNLALKGIRSGLFDFVIETNMIYYSKDFRAMLGLPLDMDFVPGDSFINMVHPDDIEDGLKRHIDNLKADGNYYRNKIRLKHIDGNYRNYEIYGYRKKNEQGHTIRMIGNLIDVHQRILNEKTIKQNKNRLQAMVNNGYAYTVLLDIEGQILMSDNKTLKSIKRIHNIDHRTQKTKFLDVIPINFKNKFVAEFNEALKGNTIKKQIEHASYEGNLHWYETKLTPILGSEKKVNSILISFHDITEHKLADLSIKEAHLKEQELSHLKSNILSNFSHEIRTPLNGIMTISKLLSQERQPEEQSKLLAYLDESNKRLLKTVNNLSSYSEIENLKNNLNFNKIDVNYAVETSFREYRHMARAKNIRYHLELDQLEPKANLDESLFKPALDNVINNAIKYTDEGEIEVKIKSQKTDNKIFITITDTGIGVKKESLKKIFDPFVQESYGLSRKYEGTGIGLSLSKKYIEILGGKIKVTSELGKGSQFSIIIPKDT